MIKCLNGFTATRSLVTMTITKLVALTRSLYNCLLLVNAEIFYTLEIF